MLLYQRDIIHCMWGKNCGERRPEKLLTVVAMPIIVPVESAAGRRLWSRTYVRPPLSARSMVSQNIATD